MAFTIRLAKESFKFSCTHFTIFSSGSKERLHGHNYQLACEIEIEALDEALGMAFDFNEIKPHLKAICDQLDECILLPGKSSYLKITSESKQVHAQFNDKSYSFPETEVKILPLVNITSEELARYSCRQLVTKLGAKFKFKALAVTVEETLGQSVRYSEPGQ